MLYLCAVEEAKNPEKQITAEQVTRKLRKAFGQAQEEFELIVPGDKVMVCLSGGKDSYTMLDIVLHYRMITGNSFDVVAVNLDQKQPGFPEHILPEYLSALGVEYRIIERDTYSVVKDKIPEGKTMCSLCSRLRRGILYDVADEIGATKMALGHHRDDILETFFLNLFFAGKLETMPAKFRTDDGRHVVIRPLAYCQEEDISRYAAHRGFPIIPCNLCGSQENLQRKAVRRMMDEWETKFPDRKSIMFTALKNVHTSHLLDRSQFDFLNLETLLAKEK